MDWPWILWKSIPFGAAAVVIRWFGPARIMIWVGVQMATRGESLISAGLAWARRDQVAKVERAKRMAALGAELKSIEGRA
jgi:hypothetical protein